MLESEAPERRAMIVAHLLLLGIESYALAYDLLWLAVCTPDRKGTFEADD
jgi:hypothetical protein